MADEQNDQPREGAARAVLGSHRRVRGDLPDDVQEGRHRAVPVREAADGAALPRPPPAQPVARRSREVHRLRAVRVGLPGRRHLRRGREQHRATSASHPGERYGRVYQINYLRCILCGLCIEACPTRALTMTNEYELADNNRADLIYEKSDLLAPLLPGMEQPPHPMLLGDDEGDYYRGNYMHAAAHTESRETPTPSPGRGAARGERPLMAFWILAPIMVDRRPRHPVRPQGRARRAAAGRRDDQPGDAVRRARRAVPLRGPDHRLHRRDLDAVPVRADARRGRRVRLRGRDHPGSAAMAISPGCCSARCS